MFSKENYKEQLWRLPAADLLYVGRSTRNTLDRYGIQTIGELAPGGFKVSGTFIWKKWVWCFTLLQMAGTSHLYRRRGMKRPIKSIGNSTTTPRDLENNLDVQIVLMALAESVAARLQETWLQMQGGVHHHPG
ncbi:MAG: hypothetical protein ACLURP_01480 [Ruminococcus sp.]